MSVGIGFIMQPQAEDEWCWAANAASAANFFGSTTWSQCSLANNQFAQTTCCADGSSDQCDKPWRLDLALTAVGCNYQYESGAIALAQLLAELGANHAVEVRIGWTDGNGNFDGSGHFVAITAADPASTMLHIADPWYPASDLRYDDFRLRYQNVGEWTDTFIIDRLTGAAGAAGGAPPRQPQAQTDAMFKKAAVLSASMKQELPLFTVSLDKAAAANPLAAMKQTGVQLLSDEGFAEKTGGSTALSIRAGARGVSQSSDAQNASTSLKDPRVLQIPSLLVTAVVGGAAGGGTSVKPIGRIPSFLEDRIYAQSDFETIIQREAQRKVSLLQDLPKDNKAGA